jgi:hypothetical protein
MIWSSNRRLRNAIRQRQLLRPAHLTVLCVRGSVPRNPRTPIADAAIVWRREIAIGSERMALSPDHCSIPFRFDLPADVPEMSRPGEPDPIVWLLSVDMTTCALSDRFALPIHRHEPVAPRSAA